MANANITIPSRQLMSHTTLTATIRVTGMRMFAIRAWCATRLMVLAARLLGCGLSIDLEQKPRW